MSLLTIGRDMGLWIGDSKKESPSPEHCGLGLVVYCPGSEGLRM